MDRGKSAADTCKVRGVSDLLELLCLEPRVSVLAMLSRHGTMYHRFNAVATYRHRPCGRSYPAPSCSRLSERYSGFLTATPPPIRKSRRISAPSQQAPSDHGRCEPLLALQVHGC
jgi:hypothetical protein